MLSIVFVFAQAWLDLQIPGYMSNITYLITSETSELTPILQMGTKMVLCAVRKSCNSNNCWIFCC